MDSTRPWRGWHQAGEIRGERAECLSSVKVHRSLNPPPIGLGRLPEPHAQPDVTVMRCLDAQVTLDGFVVAAAQGFPTPPLVLLFQHGPESLDRYPEDRRDPVMDPLRWHVRGLRRLPPRDRPRRDTHRLGKPTRSQLRLNAQRRHRRHLTARAGQRDRIDTQHLGHPRDRNRRRGGKTTLPDTDPLPASHPDPASQLSLSHPGSTPGLTQPRPIPHVGDSSRPQRSSREANPGCQCPLKP